MVANATDGFSLGDAFGAIKFDVSSIDASVRQAQASFDSAIANMGNSMKRMGDQMSNVGSSLTMLTAPLTAMGVVGLKAASDFDSLMKSIEIFGGVTGDELEKVRLAALELGAATKFSSSDAAAGLLDLLKSGQALEEAMSTLPAVMDLAAAGEMSLAAAAGITSSALAQFGLAAEDARSVSDALAKAANASRADVTDLGQALANVGPDAARFGLDINETSAILGVFSNAGIEGAEAGTKLKSMLLAMSSDTKSTTDAWQTLGTSLYDSNGNIRDLNVVIQELDSALDKLPIQQQNQLMMDLAGSYGVTALSALRTAGGIDDMLQKMEEAPDAAAVAASFMNTFAGRVESLKGSIETLMIEALTPLMNEVLAPMVGWLTEVVNGITAWVQANPRLAAVLVRMLALLTTIGPSLLIMGKMMGAIGALTVSFGQALGLVTTLLSGAFLPVIIAVGAVIFAYRRNLFGVRDAVLFLTTAFRNFFGALLAGVEPLDAIFTLIGDLFGNRVESLIYTVVGAVADFWLVLSQGGSVFRALNIGFGVWLSSIFNMLGFSEETSARLQAVYFETVRNLSIAFDRLVERFQPIRDGFYSVSMAIRGFFERLGEGQSLAVNFIQTLFDLFPATVATRILVAALRIRNAISTAFQSILNFDFSALKDGIVTGIQNVFDGIRSGDINLESVGNLLRDNLDAVLKAALTGIALLVGGPVGLGISLGKLVAMAIENDFLGIGTFLQESGIASSVENAFNTVRSEIERIWREIFSGPGIDTSPIQNIFSGIGNALNGVMNFFTPFFAQARQILQENILPGLQGIGLGVQGFFANLQGADTTGVARVLQILQTAFLGLQNIAGELLGGVLAGVGTALPKLDTTLKSFLDGLSDLTRGDVGGFFENLGTGLVAFGDALTDIPEGLADGVINLLENMTGLDLPAVSEGLEALGRGLSDAWLAATLIFDMVKRDFSRFFLEIQLDVQKYILGFRQTILEATGGRIDIAPNIQVDTQKTLLQLQTMDLADELHNAILTSLNTGEPIDLSGSLRYAVSEEAIQQFGTDTAQMLANSLSVDARRLLPQAVATAFASNDSAALEVLLPIAAKLDVDQTDLMLQIAKKLYDTEGAIAAQGFLDTFAIPLLTELQIPTEDLTTQFQEHIALAAQAQTYDAIPPVDAQMNPDRPGLIQQFAAMITAAATAQTFSANTSTNVTVNANSVNTSPFQTAVQTALNSAMNLVSGFVNLNMPNFGSLLSRDSGGRGMPGVPYAIGVRAQPEVFIPDSAGTFIPNFDKMMAGGDTIHVNVYANDRQGGEAAGEGFEAKVREKRRSRGS